MVSTRRTRQYVAWRPLLRYALFTYKLTYAVQILAMLVLGHAHTAPCEVCHGNEIEALWLEPLIHHPLCQLFFALVLAFYHVYWTSLLTQRNAATIIQDTNLKAQVKQVQKEDKQKKKKKETSRAVQRLLEHLGTCAVARKPLSCHKRGTFQTPCGQIRTQRLRGLSRALQTSKFKQSLQL